MKVPKFTVTLPSTGLYWMKERSKRLPNQMTDNMAESLADSKQAFCGISSNEREKAALRTQVEQHLLGLGFAINNGRILAPVQDDKDRLRDLHADAVIEKRAKAQRALGRYEERFIGELALGDDIDVPKIQPVLVPVTSWRSFESQLWRWLVLHWSIPVSSGYGRRLRFLVIDRAHGGKVMGLIGLADPVFALKPRDQWIGWSRERRAIALANVMDAFALGAIPPYNALRAGKLMALLTTSSEIREAFRERYSNRYTLISQRNPRASLALVTTTSALGRSSVYNRLIRPDGDLALHPLGYTAGSGDFHFSGSIYEILMNYAKRNGLAAHNQRHERWPGYESGAPRSRRAVLERALRELGFNPKALRVHGVRRQVFVAPLLANAPAFLRGDDIEPKWRDLASEELSAWWLQRWALPRARRDDAWRDFQRASWRLW